MPPFPKTLEKVANHAFHLRLTHGLAIFWDIQSRVVRNNHVSPEIFVSEIWMQEDAKNGVEIMELNSSNSKVEKTSHKPANNFSQAWSFVNHDRFRDTEEVYQINKIARERRRKKNEAEHTVTYANEYLNDHDTQTNFNGFHYIDDSEISGVVPHSEQMKFFTIINNHVINSDSSSDNEYARGEDIEPYVVENNEGDNTYWDHVYKDYRNDIMTYDPIHSEKRTVWIYSFKNKRRLSENDFELLNIPSDDSTNTSTSPLTDDERTDKRSNTRRRLSPIPATFIPKLDLSLAQTLSTVTELTEFKNSAQSSKESLVIKPVNNWLTDRNIQKTKTEPTVNWMALSPRERRRRFKNTDSDSENEDRSEIFTYAEGNTNCKETSHRTSLIQVDVEVHATDVHDTTPVTDIEIVSIEGFELKPEVENKKAKTLSIDIEYADADTEIDNENGDCNLDLRRKPAIKLISDKTYEVMTEPIEALNSSRWIIGDETDDQDQTIVLDYFLSTNEDTEKESYKSVDVSDSVSKRLWMTNTKLMKSPLWTEYLPITETPLSLHLSLSLTSLEAKKSWFKRFLKYFKCCK